VLHDERRAYYAESMASAIGEAAWWEKDERRAFDRSRAIDRVDQESVRAVFRKYVLDPAPVRVYLRPEHVPLYVRLFGWMVPMGGSR
jgi:predicted Zn-dependent peptidase